MIDDELIKFTEEDFSQRSQEILCIAKNQQVAIVDANNNIITVIGVGKTCFLPDPVLDFELDDTPVKGVRNDHNPWLD